MKKYFFGFSFIFSSIALFVVLPQSTYAATNLPGGDITSDTLWTKANSPYVILGDLNIVSGVTLTIEPGVIVKMDGSFMNMHGTLFAEGTNNDPIQFTSATNDSLGGDTNGDGSESTPSVFDWGGLTFYTGSEHSVLSHLKFRYIGEPLYFDTTSGELDNVDVQYCEIAVSTYGSTLSVKDSTFVHLDFDGIDGYRGSSITIASSTVEDVGGTGLGMYDNSNLTLKDSRIKNLSSGDGVGLYDSSAIISDSSFEGIERDSIGAYDSRLTFRDSSIKGLDWSSGIYGSGLSTIDISGSAFDSGQTGVVLYGNNWSGGDSSLTVASSTFRNFSYAGISAGDLVSGNVTSSTFEQNFIGLDVWSTPFVIHDNSIHGNDFLGIWNETSSDVVNAKNNWWGDATGPLDIENNVFALGDAVTSFVDYTPWLTEDPTLPKIPTCCSSVAFIPGLEASRLYKQGTIFEDQLWEPNFYTDVQALGLDANGKSKDPSLYTRDIIDNVDVVGTKIYQSFIEEMDSLKTAGTVADWKPLPYDWRLSAEDIVSNPVKLEGGKTASLISQIENLAATSKTAKVTIIAHSNGGLVAKLLIKKLEEKGEAGLIDKLILVAVPQLGTPKAISSLLHGYDEALGYGAVAGAGTMRTFAENMPGAYQLLPSTKYFENISDPVITFDPSIDAVSNFRKTFGNSISSTADLKDFLLGTDGRTKPSADDITLPNILNSTVLGGANSLHNDIDSYQIPSNIAVTQIAGWGLNTIKGIKYQTKDVTVCVDKGVCQTNKELDMRPVLTEEGDNTVVSPSATGVNVASYYTDLHKYNQNFSLNASHADVLEVSKIRDLINNIIIGTSTLPDFITVDKPTPASDDKRLNVSAHSPISLDLYDSNGHHTGLVAIPNSDFNYREEQIPNSYYFELGDGKYVGFPDDNSTKVKIAGTGIGTFTLEIDRTITGRTVATSTFVDLPVLPTTQASLTISATSSSLTIDLDGDQKTDFILSPGQTFDSVVYLTVMKNVVSSLNLQEGITKPLLAKIDSATKMIQKGTIKNANKMITSMLHQIQVKSKQKVNKKIDSENGQLLVTILNTLLDNLKTQ